MTRSVDETSARPALRLSGADLLRLAATALVVAVLVRHLGALTQVLLLAYAAIVLAVALNGLVRLVPVERRWGAAIIALVTLAGVVAGVWFGGRAVFAQLQDLSERLPELERELRGWGEWLRERTGLDVQLIGERTEQMVQDFLGNIGGQQVLGRAWGVIEAIAFGLLIFFGGVFALAQPNERLLTPLLRLFPSERRGAARRAATLLGERLLGWIRGQLISMATVGVLTTIGLYVVGVPYALLLGTVNGLAEFVPIIGPWVGGIPAVVLGFLESPTTGLWTMLVILTVQQIESHLVTPLVMSKVADVHPFITIFSIVLFGGLFGFLGILLALPLVLLLWTVVQVFWVEEAIETADDRIAPVVDSK